MTLDLSKYKTGAQSQSTGLNLGNFQKPTPPANDMLDNPVTRTVESVFPGKEVGGAIGTLGGLATTKIGDLIHGTNNTAQYDTSAPSPLRVAGDIAQGALTVAAPNIGGETALGRIGANAALGAGIGSTGAIAEGGGVSDVAKQGAVGGALGGGLSAATEFGSYLASNLPKWFTKLALPKLANSPLKGTSEETINYALDNAKGTTLKEMLDHSGNAIKSYEGQVQSILNHPNYVGEVGDIQNGIGSVAGAFPNAQLDDSKIINILKQVAPQNKTLVDKVADGTANLSEQNILRKELDSATKKAYGDKPTLTFAKSVGKSMADFLRGNVQDTAQETKPIFSNYSKELQLNKALQSAFTKKRVAGPLLAGSSGAAGGFATGGLGGAVKGAAEMIAVEEGLRSPTAKLLAAKAVRGASNVLGPTIGAVAAGGKAPLIKQVTSK